MPPRYGAFLSRTIMNIASQMLIGQRLARRQTYITCEESVLPTTKRTLELMIATLFALAQEFRQEIAAGLREYEDTVVRFLKIIPRGLPADVSEFVVRELVAELSQ